MARPPMSCGAGCGKVPGNRAKPGDDIRGMPRGLRHRFNAYEAEACIHNLAQTHRTEEASLAK